MRNYLPQPIPPNDGAEACAHLTTIWLAQPLEARLFFGITTRDKGKLMEFLWRNTATGQSGKLTTCAAEDVTRVTTDLLETLAALKAPAPRKPQQRARPQRPTNAQGQRGKAR
jgi:hypothetical protein